MFSVNYRNQGKNFFNIFEKMRMIQNEGDSLLKIF